MNQLTIIERRTLEQHEKVIERGLQTFYEVGRALLAIRDGRLYRQQYGTFEAYCEQRWGMSSRRAYHMIEAAEVVLNVKNFSHPPEVEAQARPLAQLPASEQPEVWQRAVETAPEGKVTAQHVQRTVDQYQQERGRTSRLYNEVRQELRKQGQVSTGLSIPGNLEWEVTPEVKDLIKAWQQVEHVLIPQTHRLFELGKASPEAKGFILRLMRRVGEQLFEATEYGDTDEQTHD